MTPSTQHILYTMVLEIPEKKKYFFSINDKHNKFIIITCSANLI